MSEPFVFILWCKKPCREQLWYINNSLSNCCCRYVFKIFLETRSQKLWNITEITGRFYPPLTVKGLKDFSSRCSSNFFYCVDRLLTCTQSPHLMFEKGYIYSRYIFTCKTLSHHIKILSKYICMTSARNYLIQLSKEKLFPCKYLLLKSSGFFLTIAQPRVQYVWKTLRDLRKKGNLLSS